MAVIYAESTTSDLGGEDETEKLAIGATFVNRAYYATKKPPSGKGRCYNSDFGNGTVCSAITARNGSQAVGQPLWQEIVAGNDLKSQKNLEKELKLNSHRRHYNLSVKAALATDALTSPISIHELSDSIPIAFDQSPQDTPSPRWKRIGQVGTRHYFYAFTEGRECE
ncbi:MAG TPA: hypothetical protein VF173_02315 [Thermoanaerobaculia bacterium]|nr:hypothetical protein [Thermoanaerobaculia bacterium]